MIEFHTASHEFKKLWEANGAVALGIYLVYYVLELSLSVFLTNRAHDGLQSLVVF